MWFVSRSLHAPLKLRHRPNTYLVNWSSCCLLRSTHSGSLSLNCCRSCCWSWYSLANCRCWLCCNTVQCCIQLLLGDRGDLDSSDMTCESCCCWRCCSSVSCWSWLPDGTELNVSISESTSTLCWWRIMWRRSQTASLGSSPDVLNAEDNRGRSREVWVRRPACDGNDSSSKTSSPSEEDITTPLLCE